jgi:glycosyltransferase involved in cell wall biosynthesis
LLVTFSDNADHQDITFGMFESLYKANRADCDAWVMGINTPKVSIMDTPHTHLVDCPKRPGIEKKTFDLKTLSQIIRWINAQHFDVIFFETLHVWNLAIMACCHSNVRIFQMIHDLIPHTGDKQVKSVNLMNKTVCKMADTIVLCNQKYAAKVTELYGVKKEKVLCVDMWRRFPNYLESCYTRQVLFFGRMNPYKGMNNLLRITELCPDIRFNVVGKVDSQVETEIQELKKKQNVVLKTGYVTDEEMREAFINSDWVILPYNSATQSGVVIDAYRYGKPVIAFDVGAVSEQIEEGISGFLVEAGDVEQFVQVLRKAIGMNKASYVELSRGAYNYGIKKYAAEGAVDRFVRLVEKKSEQC